VPLYFAAPRPVVEREGTLLMVDDDRFVLRAGETVVEREVRFRTMGCYPLTGASPSAARDVAGVIAEMADATQSERSGRVIDRDPGASMEHKKREGYF
jgi:sulfate adenylyltransferase subunit 2